MKTSRRDLLSFGVAATAAATMATLAPRRLLAADAASGLKSMTADVVPIGRPEFLARIDRVVVHRCAAP